MGRLAFASMLGVTLACAGSPVATERPEPEPKPEPAPERGFGPWIASVARDHPLVGTAWAVADGSSSPQALTRAELEARVAAARFVLLGETHDHPDHHRLQGELITSLLAAEPAVVYEMLDPALQAEIDAFVAAGSGDVDGFAELVAWADSGWPAWALYRPAFAPVIEAGLPIIAALVPRTRTREFMSEGLALLEPELVARYGLDQPLSAALLEPQLDEMFVAHCEMVPREQLAPMVEIQRLRDAVMADALLRGAAAQGRAVLVAGTGHTRRRGVPRLLELAGQDGAAILSVGFVAVDPERRELADYLDADLEGGGPDHDVLVLTPAIEREDPCAAMRAGG